MKSCLHAAHWYADRLGPVLPCNAGKFPYTEHGVLDATADHDKIDAYWKRWPWARVAIACTRLFVVDVDPRNGGDVTLEAFESEHGKLPHTVEQLTPSGGRHILFHGVEGVRYRKTLGPGLDIQAGPGKYILAAPSTNRLGQYRWELSARPDEVPLTDAPSWVLARALRFEPAIDHGRNLNVGASLLARAFAHVGWLREKIDDVRYSVRCPWEAEHTGGERGSPSSTVIFAPKTGSALGWFHCSHTSHGPKSMRDVMAVLPVEAVFAASASFIAEHAGEDDDDDDETDHDAGEREGCAS